MPLTHGKGQTPLLCAVQDRHEEIIDTLLGYGTDLQTRGETPHIHLADPVSAVHPNGGVKLDWDKDVRIAVKIMQAGVDLNAPDDGDNVGASLDLQDCTRRVGARTGRGWRVHVNIRKGPNGKTLLYLAAIFLFSPDTDGAIRVRIAEVLDLVSANDANENLRCDDGITPFELL